MSGDVQPRKRKDKKRKKDELGVEEPRGTAAVFGEGDVFMHMHSPNEHGTGGHWCAKVIFFSLLAILITLVGLIILENRGLTDLEANSVESRYSGVLEGWLEDAHGDDHHDEHTLELKHQDDVNENDRGDELKHDDEEDQDDEEDHDDEDDHYDEYENDNEDEENNNDDEDEDEDEQNQDDEDDNEDDDQNDDNSDERTEEADNEDEVEEHSYRRVNKRDIEANDDDDEDDDSNQDDENDNNNDDEQQFGDNYSDEDNDQLEENNDVVNTDDDNDNEEDYENNDSEDNDFHSSIENKDEDSNEFDQNLSEARDDEDEEEHEDEPKDVEIEVERIEKEVSEEDDASSEVPSYADIAEEDGESQDDEKDGNGDIDEDVEEEEYLEPEDEELPVVEHITVPAGKPLAEVEDETSSERPPDTLADEEEYEKQQEELRREQEQASHLWLKLAVGGALLAATHAVVRRATAPRAARADTPPSDEHASREETPSYIDRRMTLIMEETSVPVVPKNVPRETPKPIEREVVKKMPIVVKTPPSKQESEEEEVEIPIITKAKQIVQAMKDKELYSDDEDEEEEIIETKKDVLKKTEPVIEKQSTPEPEEPEDDDDVEIIDDEQLEEEIEEEDVEEEISDVDDAELLSRLEAKYGRLPEPERPGQKHKDGGNSLEDEWPGEPSDSYWREQLDRAEEDLQQGEWSSAWERAGGAGLAASGRARWLVARALDAGADERRDNKLLTRAIAAYLDLLKMNERLTDVQLRTVTVRTLDRILFRGNYIGAEPVYRLLIRRFPDEPGYRNNLTISFLMANRADLAEEVLKETLKRWPNDRIALAHHGFVLKTQHNRLEEAVTAFQKALEGDTGPANEPRFYYHLGDALLLLGRFREANEVHKRGAALGHFLSPTQRSLYNVNHLTGRPWWNIEDTPYIKLIKALEKSWKEILKEGEAARSIYEKEKEGLKEKGEWSQLDLFARGREIPGRCDKAPVTCSIVRAEVAASGCRRGQIKFSSMEAGTHVRPHVGPTNCRLRMHLGLSNTKDTFIRVDKETRQWKTGKVFIFDDSFEHEVWHNGTGTRLVLIVDVWHPDLTPAERRQLPAI